MGVAADEILLEIRDLAICYRGTRGKSVNAVNGVNLTVNPAQVLGIIGESGSGKSTLAAAVLRLLPPGAEIRSGSVRFEGHDVLSMRSSELRSLRGARMALVPQDPAISLNPVMKIGSQISEVLRAHGQLKRKDREKRVVGLLREVGFDDADEIYSAYPHELSGGQRQRVVIARAMACGPALVIADEPTSKLDPALQSEILQLMRSLVAHNRAALIFITHDPAILAGFAHRIAVMYAGRIVEEGIAEEVLNRPMHPYTQALLRLFPSDTHKQKRAARLSTISGESPALTQTGPGCRFEPRCPERMPRCGNEDPPESTPSTAHRVSCFKYVH